jgi:hypothetical protein
MKDNHGFRLVKAGYFYLPQFLKARLYHVNTGYFFGMQVVPSPYFYPDFGPSNGTLKILLIVPRFQYKLFCHDLALSRNGSISELESTEDLARLADPMLALKDLKGLVVMEEVQWFYDG